MHLLRSSRAECFSSTDQIFLTTISLVLVLKLEITHL